MVKRQSCFTVWAHPRVSTQVSMRLSTSHLRCDFSVKGASVKRCSFPVLGSLTASFDWTLGCLNRWQHGEPNQPCNPPLGFPPCCCRTTRRICCTTIPCGSPEKQADHCSQNLIGFEKCVGVCARAQTAAVLFTHTSFKWPSFVCRLPRLYHFLWCLSSKCCITARLFGFSYLKFKKCCISLLFIWKCIIRFPSRYKGLICKKDDWV